MQKVDSMRLKVFDDKNSLVHLHIYRQKEREINFSREVVKFLFRGCAVANQFNCFIKYFLFYL